MHKDINLRTTFDERAQLYHEIRPHYPDAIFEALIKETNLQKDAKLLEIGPGTGQATEPLAKLDYDIVAVELGANMAKAASKALEKYKNVRVILSAFEDADLPSESFDLIYAATAFHWVKPEVGFAKSHKLLKSRGYLALIDTKHVSDEAGDKIVEAYQPLYHKYQPSEGNKKFRLPKITEIKPQEIDQNLFRQTFFGVFPMDVQYTADEYVRLLSTYSSVSAINPESRPKFLEGIRDIINNDFGGKVKRYFGMSLTIAKKKN